MLYRRRNAGWEHWEAWPERSGQRLVHRGRSGERGVAEHVPVSVLGAEDRLTALVLPPGAASRSTRHSARMASRLAGRTGDVPESDHAASLRRGFVYAALFANAIGPAWLLPDGTPLASVPFVVIALPLLVVRSTRRLRALAGALGALLCALAVALFFAGGVVLLPGGLLLVAAATLPRHGPRDRGGSEWLGTLTAAFAMATAAAALFAMAVDAVSGRL